MQAHTLGEVAILGTVLLRVSSGTILPIFIEIGSYLTDKEQNNKLAEFFWDGVYTVYKTRSVTLKLRKEKNIYKSYISVVW